MAKKILLIDDDKAFRSVVKDALGDLGCEIHEADAGAAGLEKAGEIVPDLIVLDVQMPGMDGFTVLCKLYEKPETSKIPVIMLTGKARTEDIFKQYASVRRFFAKPVAMMELVRAAKKILSPEG